MTSKAYCVSDVLGCRLTAIFDMHGVRVVYAFSAKRYSVFSVIELPEVAVRR